MVVDKAPRVQQWWGGGGDKLVIPVASAPTKQV